MTTLEVQARIIEAVLMEQYQEAYTLDSGTRAQAINGKVTASLSAGHGTNIDLHTIAVTVKDIATIVGSLITIAKALNEAKVLLAPTSDANREANANTLTTTYGKSTDLKNPPAGISLIEISRTVLSMLW